MIDLYINKKNIELEVKGSVEEILEESVTAAYEILKMIDCPIQKSVSAFVLALIAKAEE